MQRAKAKEPEVRIHDYVDNEKIGPDLPLLFKMHEIWSVDSQETYHQMPDFKAKIHQIRFRLELRPDPSGEAYSAAPDPLYLWAPTSNGRERKDIPGKGREERKRKRERKGKGGDGGNTTIILLGLATLVTTSTTGSAKVQNHC